jgi:hypothetical protein
MNMPKKTPKKPVKRAVKALFRCMRCKSEYTSWKSLQRHSKTHLSSLEELKMLQQGKVPEMNKIGSEFKGKNRIIIS